MTEEEAKEIVGQGNISLWNNLVGQITTLLTSLGQTWYSTQ